MEEELLELEKKFADAIVKNDPEAVGRIVTDDWISSMPMEELLIESDFLE
jgi:hypothetical protein